MAGDLFSVDMAIKMAQKAEGVGERIRIEVAKTSSIARADRERDEKVWTAKLEAKDSQIEFLESKLNPSVWAEIIGHPALWFLAGVAVTIGIVAVVEHRPQPVDR